MMGLEASVIKSKIWIVSLTSIALLLNCSSPVGSSLPAQEKPNFREVWVVRDRINAPAGAYADVRTGNIYVTLNPGTVDARNGQGRIAKLGHDGKLIEADWVSGLNAPKGLRGNGITLWVTDIDEIIAIDIASRKVLSRTRVQDAKSLSGIAVAEDGVVYVSDPQTDKIYLLRNGTVSLFVDNPIYDPPLRNRGGIIVQDPVGASPEGIVVDGSSLVVGGGGRDKFSGYLYRLNLATKERTVLYPWPFANIDSIESDGKGGYLTSDSKSGIILRLPINGKAPQFLQQLQVGAGRIAFIPSDQRLVVPYTRENKITAYDISDALK
jgi:hypothetical protein